MDGYYKSILDEWQELKQNYPSPDLNKIKSVFNTLAPIRYSSRIPIFEFGHETTPSITEVWEISTRIVMALDGYKYF